MELLQRILSTPGTGLAFAIGIICGSVAVSLFVGILGAIHGKYITNASLSLKIRRTSRSNESNHDLVTIIRLEKESTNALILKTIKVELFEITDGDLNEHVRRWNELAPNASRERSEDDTWMPVRQTNGQLNRSLNCSGKLHSERRVLAFWTSEIGRPENLAPLEKTQYATYSNVESDKVYEAVVTIVGIRYTSRPMRFFARKLGQDKAYYTASTITGPKDADQGEI